MFKRFLPLIPAGLAVVQVLPTPERVTILAQPLSATAACPNCGTMPSHLHSRYERTLGDLPWQGRPVVLRIQARRFRCLCPTCPRQTFAERLGAGAAACSVCGWDADAGSTGARAVTEQPPSAPQIARLLMADTDALPAAERGFIAQLLAEAPRLANAMAVAKRLNPRLRRKSEKSLDRLFKDAAGTQLSEFAAGLKRDLAAARAALDMPWTTSPAEGQINRIKTIKCSIYGCAGFQLLRARVLQAA